MWARLRIQFGTPLASASGGLLPTFGTSLEHTDLTDLSDIVDALTDALANISDGSVLPGLPANSLTTVLGGTPRGRSDPGVGEPWGLQSARSSPARCRVC